jgi:radical SAM superfamily enzyme YgiQ (UPF0313 family)
MKVVLVDNLLIEQNGTEVETVLQPHLGLISLLAVLDAGGHDGRLYDPKLALSDGRIALDRDLYLTIARELVALAPDVVGFTSLGCNFICTLRVAQHVRRMAPGVAILLGGPHATILDRVILERYACFDAVLRHEAEATLPAVLDALPGGRLAGIPGVTYRDRGAVIANPGTPIIESLDDLPIPSYEHYPVDRLALAWLRVEAGRGCPFACTFCSTASFFGRTYRLKSADRLCRELDLLHARYGVRQFSLQHDLFTVNRDKVMEFCEAVEPRGYTWKCSARMDCVDPELLRVMARAGCREIYFGVETGSPRLQQLAKKRLDLTLFYPTLDAADAAGIRPTVSFITGYPQELATDQAATLDLIGSCFYRRPPPSNIQLHLMTPEPGTELLAQFRDRLAFDGFISDFTFPTLEPDDPDVIASAPDVFMNNHYFVAELPRRRHVVVSTLYYVLYDLSPAVLCYLLDAVDGRLSRLVDAFDAWALAHGVTIADRAQLVAFCADWFGPADHRSSLVRYMTVLATMRRPAPRRHVVGAPALVRRRGDAYVRNPEVRVLHDIHDCSVLVARIEELHAARRRSHDVPLLPAVAQSGLLELRRHRGAAPRRVLEDQIERDWSALAAPCPPVRLDQVDDQRGDLLVVPIAGTDRVRNLALHPGVASLLELFAVPRSRRAVAQLASGGSDVLRELIALEVLIPAAAAATPRPRATSSPRILPAS